MDFAHCLFSYHLYELNNCEANVVHFNSNMYYWRCSLHFGRPELFKIRNKNSNNNIKIINC